MTDHPFEASNGLWITPRHDHVFWHSGQSRPKVTAALREYFRHERDQQLGRARWPEDPDYVIYRDPGSDGRDGRRVRVLYEPDGFSVSFWETLVTVSLRKFERAAYWYVKEILGKPNKRPWEDAKEGEVWRLTVNGKERNGIFDGDDFALPNINGADLFYAQSTSALITAGRKLLNADGTPADE